MHQQGSQSWQIRLEEWSERYELPLWIRAAERIPAANALVPGPLAVDPLPEPSVGAGLSLAKGWLAWWYSVLQVPAVGPVGRPPAALDLTSPPDFPGLRPWPALREVVMRRWPEAHEWHRSRKEAGPERFRPGDLRMSEVVKEVERALGRPVKPFTLELTVLPVLDDELRAVTGTRYIVPERLYASEAWPARLRPLVAELGA